MGAWCLGLCLGRLCSSLSLSHFTCSLPLSAQELSLALYYSLPHSCLDFTTRSGSVLRRIGRGGSPRHRLRVDAKFATFHRRFAARVGKQTLFQGERFVPDKIPCNLWLFIVVGDLMSHLWHVLVYENSYLQSCELYLKFETLITCLCCY